MVAYTEIRQIPAGPFLSAAAKARTVCDHPAKIIPAIIRGSQEWSDNLLRVERTKRAQYENATAPSLKQQAEVMPDEDREAVAALLRETQAALRSAH